MSIDPAPAPAAGTITISHTNDEGTLVHGTARGDGTRDALKLARFKWSRKLGAWYLPSSRGRAAKRTRIELLESRLTDAGFKVEVDIEEYDAAQAFDALQTHGEERADALAAGARPAQRSNDALRHTRRRENPVVMGRRIERLRVRQRELQRWLQGAGDAPLRRAELADIEAEIAFLRRSIEQSGIRQFTQADIHQGNEVKLRGQWRTVARANPKTVAVKTAYSWTDKYPYHEITDHRRSGAARPPSLPENAVRVTLAHSEVCMHMRIAGRERWVAPAGPGMAQVFDEDGTRLSAPITRGEAGLIDQSPPPAELLAN